MYVSILPIQFFMSLAALVVLIVHLFTKPYKNEYINIIEAIILLDLLLTTGAFLDPSSEQVPFGLGVFVAVLPYVYAVGCILYRIWIAVW